MDTINCTSCQNTISKTASFCGKCGNQVKCTECKDILSPGANFCESCGKPVSSKSTSNTHSPNKVKFQENADGRFFEAEFSNEVGKDLTNTLGEILTARQLAIGNIEKPMPSNGFSGTPDNKNQDQKGVEDVQFEETTNTQQKSTNYPSLHSVVMKNLPTNESEWIVVYSFYASSFGEKIFTRQNIIDLYGETNRKTDSRMKNLSPYITTVVKSNSINPINNKGEFSILDKGIERAIEIISRTTSSPAKTVKSNSSSSNNSTKDDKKTPSKAVKASGSKKGFSVLDLGISETNRQKLRDFFKEKNPKSQEDIVLVLGYWLQKEGNIAGFGADEIYTAIQIVSVKTPSSLGQVLINLKNASKLTKDGASKMYKLNHVGEDFVKFDLPKKN